MLAAGSRVGDYVIEAPLGEGGMATVYRARHVVLDTIHALKVLDRELRADEHVRQRFLEEAKLQAKELDHPGIVKVTNIVTTADHAALVMELIEGPSLEALVGKLGDQPDELRRIMIAVLDAVGHAHGRGIIHRDLKPANILLAGAARSPKVTDFGIAKVTDPTRGRPQKKSTHIAARMGTLDYMSPEQIRKSKEVTVRSDIFSLGAMLYELATGVLPFAAENDFDVMSNIVGGRYLPPGQRVPTLDLAIAAAIERALDPDPEARFASCAEMATALRGADARRVATPPIAARVAPAPDEDGEARFRAWSTAPRSSRTPAVAVAAVAAATVVAVAIYLVVRAGSSATPPVDARLPAGSSDAGANAVALGTAPVVAPPDASTGRIASLMRRGTGTIEPDQIYAVSVNREVSSGPSDAPVTLIVAGDHACRYCERSRATIAALQARYGAALRVVHKPFVVYRKLATVSALAYCAASNQGRAAEMDELLWERGFRSSSYDLLEPNTTPCWDTAFGCRIVGAFARELRLDADQFRRDLRRCVPEIERSRAELSGLGVTGIPTFFINGRPLSNQPSDAFITLIDAELTLARGRITAGTAAADYYQHWVIQQGRRTP